MQLQSAPATDVGLATPPVVSPTSTAVSIRFEVVGGLLTALCARDRRTAEHSWRVAKYAVAATEGYLGWVARLQLGVAALLHDVGKIGIPDWVLKKPGPLNDYESTVMRMHDAIGVETLRAACIDEAVISTIQQHSTAMGTAFDFQSHSASARILRIADAFDSLVSDDVYRLGKSAPEALQEVERCVGSQFDPEWLEKLRPILEACDRHIAKPHHASRLRVTLVVNHLPELSRALDLKDVEAIRAVAAEVADVTDNRALFVLAKDLTIGDPANAASQLWNAIWTEQLVYLI